MLPLEQLREELRDHAKSDDQHMRDLRQDIGMVREDVKGLIRDTSAQTVKLDEIQQSLTQERSSRQYRRKVQLILIRALAGLACAGAGALLHHFAS